MKTIYVFGYTGMAGRYISTYLKKKFIVKGFSRKQLDAKTISENELYTLIENKCDIVINCIGDIQSRLDTPNILNAILVNSVFPQKLSNVAKKTKTKMIHITTDCVYSGKVGNYTEHDEHDVSDTYGRTKSLGEPKNCTIIRTSIIGEEVNQARSLIEWIKSMSNKKTNGYDNHFWNGVTALELAKIIEKIISNNSYWMGVKHIHSPNSVSKLELLNIVNNVFNLNIKISPLTTSKSINRTLKSIHDISNYNIPKIEDQIKEMKSFNIQSSLS